MPRAGLFPVYRRYFLPGTPAWILVSIPAYLLHKKTAAIFRPRRLLCHTVSTSIR